MRNIFFKNLYECMKKDEELFLVVADMGLGIVEPFQKEFPQRYINVGIAEQNMIGICAGLCNMKFRPVAYTISNFLIQRCFEQIRNDVCLHKYPVTLVGASTGFDNGKLGPTHQVIDDIGCLKALPEINIYSPSTVSASGMIFEELMKNQAPAYVRIGKGSFDLDISEKTVNHMAVESKKSDILVITHGNVLEYCVNAAGDSPGFSIFCMNKIKPLEREKLDGFFSKYQKIVVVEDHLVGSGLYNSLCQYLVESGNVNKVMLLSIAPPNKYEEKVGDRDYFADKYGLTSEKISKFISNLRGELN